MSSKYDPAASLNTAALYSLEELLELFEAKSPTALAHNDHFPAIAETVLFNGLTTRPKLAQEFNLPKLKTFDRGIDVETRRAMVAHFQAIVTASSGNKPPSQPEQCAPPEAEQELPDWLRKAEARLSR